MSANTTNPIAVVGMACRYPGARTLLELWENILTRRQQFRQIPAVRLPLQDYFDPDPNAPDKTYGSRAAVLDDIEIDSQRFRIPKATLGATDIVHWLALLTAWEAVERAQLVLDGTIKERAGVILGNTLTGEETRSNTMRLRWPFVRKTLRRTADIHGLSDAQTAAFEATMEELYKSVFPAVTEDTLAGGLSNTIAGRICNYLDFKGAGYTVDGACSSSLLAVATAADYLQNGKLDLAIAGGIDISLDTFELVGFSKATALTPDEMRVYDRRGNGFIPGEGCGMVVLKRLDDARRDGDTVYAVLRGWGISSDGRGGITAPNANGQARALIKAYRGAGYAPQTLDFCEGHGTGTRVGDRTELEGIAQALAAFGPAEPHAIGVTSFKSICGHTKAAAGIGGFIKAVIAVNRRVVPPTAGCSEPHELFSTTAKGLYPVTQGERRDTRSALRAGVSAMGFGGINCHVTVESGDAPAPDLAPELPEQTLLASWQQTEVFPLAGDNAADLLAACRALRSHAETASQAELTDLAADCARRLGRKTLRAAVVAGSVAELMERLIRLERALREQPQAHGAMWESENLWLGNAVTANRVGFVFPGQGSQRVGMAGDLLRRFPWARALSERADGAIKAVREHERASLPSDPMDRYLAFEHQRDPEGLTKAELQRALTATANAQPAICLASWLWHLRLKSLGIMPSVVGGHSLGELTALAAAGAYSALELMQLATARGLAMNRTGTDSGSMAVLACDAPVAEHLIRSSAAEYCVIANRNSPRQTVISGIEPAVQKVVAIAAERGITGQTLPVSAAFHSALMAEAAQSLGRSPYLPAVRPNRLCKAFSSRDGRMLRPDLDLSAHLVEQIVAPVDFMQMVDALAPHCDWLVEVGPGRVLTNLIQQRPDAALLRCLPTESQPGRDADLHAVVAAAFIRGVEIRWDRLYAHRLIRPFVPASRKKFYVNPCERLAGDESIATPAAADTDAEAGVIRPQEPVLLTRKPVAIASAPAAPVAPPPFGEQPNRAGDVLREILSELTGFSTDSLKADARLIDDLNLDSIKAGSVLAETKLRLGITGAVDTSQFINADLQAIAAALESARPHGMPMHADAQAILVDLVCKLTGFERSSLNDDLRLLDDLNIDSIKATALIADLLAATGTQGRIAPSELVNASLGELAARVQAAIPASAQRDAALPAAASPSPQWVRAFTVRKSLLPEPPAPAEPGGCRTGAAWVLSDLASPFARNLAQILRAELVEHQRLDDGMESASPDVIVVALPRTGDAAEMDHGLRDVQSLEILARFARQHGEAWKHVRTVVFVQCAGTGEPIAAPPSAKAFAASLQLERPELEVVVIETLPSQDAALIAAAVTRQIKKEAGYRYLAIDEDERYWTEEVVPVEAEQCAPRDLQWSPQDVVLVTGGGKGITAECALAFAETYGVSLAILGRSKMPMSNDSGELAVCLRRLREARVRFRYYAVDVADREALAQVLARIRAEMGPVTGVLHGASINQPRPFVKVTADEAYQEIGPKLLGAVNLAHLLNDAPPKLFACLTSIIGVTGMDHNAWYAYSNESVARLTEAFGKRHPQTAVACFAYGVWGEIGMGVKLGSIEHLAHLGVRPIPVSEGVRHFLHWLETAPPAREVIVTASVDQLPTWRRRASASSGYRFQGEPLFVEPGVERVTRVVLDTATDLYLKDHDFRGTLLFPTVMGLEAMTQAALDCAAQPDLRVIGIESIRLDQPITVDSEGSTVIEIRALVHERRSPQEPWTVEASISSEKTAFSQPHFAARIILDHSGTRSGIDPIYASTPAPLDIIPATDLYGSVLFQGSLFQRICAIESLDREHVRFLSFASADGSPSRAGFAATQPATLVLGDAYFRDSLLQAAQISLTPDVCLPIYIDRIEFFGGEPLSGVYRAEARILQRQGKRVGIEVSVYQLDGRLVERISGYEVQLLEQRNDLPKPEDLVAITARSEQAALDAAIAELENTLHVATPRYVLRRVPALHGRPRCDRRAMELPLFHTAVKGTGEPLEANGARLGLRWLSSGKPQLAALDDAALNLAGVAAERADQPPASALDVSLSHDGEFALCVAGTGRQGADIVSPQQHSREKWSLMFDRKHLDLLTRLETEGDPLDMAGARLWAALEALHKAAGPGEIRLRIVARSAAGVLFSAGTCHGELTVLTTPCRFDGTDEYMVAILVKRLRVLPDPVRAHSLKAPTGQAARNPNQKPLLERPTPHRLFMKTENPTPSTGAFGWNDGSGDPSMGDSGQFQFQIPLSFKDGSNPDGTLNFVRCFEWMGRLRETVLRPVLPQLIDDFTSRRYAWVTNRSFIQLEAPVYGGELMEVTGRFLGRGGPENATVALRFDWHRADPAGERQRVAISEIEMTWSKAVAHGVVRPAPYPDYLSQFLDRFSRRDRQAQDERKVQHYQALRSLGPALWRAPQTPGAGIRLSETSVATSQNDANLVGNVYYSKYYELQGLLLDNHLFGLMPQNYLTEGHRGLRCLFATVDHLRDAMPFDKVNVSMRIAGIYERGLELAFDFFRVLPNGNTEKLAAGSQVAVWVDRAHRGQEAGHRPMPPDLVHDFLMRVSAESERTAA